MKSKMQIRPIVECFHLLPLQRTVSKRKELTSFVPWGVRDSEFQKAGGAKNEIPHMLVCYFHFENTGAEL